MRTCLTRLQIGPFDQGLPRGQSDEGEGGRLFHGEPGRLERDVVLLDRDQLGEGADSMLVRAGVDLVSGLEAADCGADPDDESGQIIAQDHGQVIRQDGLDLAVPDFGVQRIDARGVDLNQHVVIPQLRVRHLDGVNVVVAAVAIDRECLHDGSGSCSGC